MKPHRKSSLNLQTIIFLIQYYIVGQSCKYYSILTVYISEFMFYKELWKIIKNNQRLRTSAEREFKHHFYNAKIIQLALYLSHKKIQSVEHQ